MKEPSTPHFRGALLSSPARRPSARAMSGRAGLLGGGQAPAALIEDFALLAVYGRPSGAVAPTGVYCPACSNENRRMVSSGETLGVSAGSGSSVRKGGASHSRT